MDTTRPMQMRQSIRHAGVEEKSRTGRHRPRLPGPPKFVVIDEPWSAYGTCMTADPELFFPDKGVTVAAAKRVCAHCPVVLECAEYAIRADERYGIWGGMSERERRPYVRNRRVEQ